ncbi:toast rack family protein [Schinkia azotoformans]|uniref:toast rack family protein n=1 Tax=Schinkia azotoformans TaxID=1454 RepID=UPI002DBCA499|nr:toast rack family protein [Schinkia azotoformans]MEC1720957.1 toast rack family protein [Schinkia azotoformans]MED4353091.1 toast rack family protein [Schinkia azotoformans]MED4412208.1 toast rack family protein [Schinkia azotoformans]
MKRAFFVMVTILSILLLVSCSGAQIGNLQSEKSSINIQNEKALDVSIRLGAGDLTLSGNTAKAAEVDFSYNVEELKPVIDYKIAEGEGQLSIIQSNMNKPMGNLEGLEYKGDVVLNNTLPVTLYVKTGAGKNVIDLREVQLQNAEIYSGVGETTINFAGDYKKGFDANIESGMGKTEIIVPKNIGVKILIENGIGKVETEGLKSVDNDQYVNDSYEKAKIKTNIKIKMGVGDLKIKVEE